MSGQLWRAAIGTLGGTLFLSLALSCGVQSRLAGLLEPFGGDGTTGSLTGVSPLIGFHLAALLDPAETILTVDHSPSFSREIIQPPPAAHADVLACAIVPVRETAARPAAKKIRAKIQPSFHRAKIRKEQKRFVIRNLPAIDAELSAHMAGAVAQIEEVDALRVGRAHAGAPARREEWRRVRKILARDLPAEEIKIIFRRDDFYRAER